ncbi:hypothetical protein HMPREF1531_01780 [Propionibacterium sp. oral taxon 192 str. F0372]|uniref:TMEM175 family protein n=1 Tax=Propionibacterium sp. oral taxon 192 TaxID=671222 RepID=UPI000352EB36|nr:TMEM175 family protein [Propionibacterium sp. oral taxon 192]EPH02474.1 hypothetical protein HMPREF1531_01780 [Propionibacterium sp. oral taxon 192 str. F0372]
MVMFFKRSSKSVAAKEDGEKNSFPEIGTGRLEAFSDGVMAIAITLLSLEIKLPDYHGDLLGDLVTLWPTYVGFVLSFMLIGQVWLNHHAVFHILRVVDQRVLIFNLLLLLDVVFLPFATSVLADSLEIGSEARVGAVFYGGVMVVGGLLFNALWHSAIRNPSNLKFEISESVVKRMSLRFAFGPFLYMFACVLGIVNVWLSIGTYICLIMFYMMDSMSTSRG